MSKGKDASEAAAVPDPEIENVPTTFSVDGVDYTLKFGMVQQKSYQLATGEPAISALIAIEKSFEEVAFDMVRLSAMFRHSIVPRVEEDASDELIDRVGFHQAAKMIFTAAREAYEGLQDPQKAPPAK